MEVPCTEYPLPERERTDENSGKMKSGVLRSFLWCDSRRRSALQITTRNNASNVPITVVRWRLANVC